MFKKSLIFASIFLSASVSFAAVSPKTVATVKSALPELGIVSLKETNVPNVFEAKLESSKIYVDSTGRYVLLGQKVFDTKATQAGAPQAQQQQSSGPDYPSQIDMAELNKANAIKTVKGTGERELYVFSDPDCPFCQRLEQELTKVTDVTIYTFLYPIKQLHPNAVQISKQIWCSADRAKAWEAYMLRKEVPVSGSGCSTPVEANVSLMEKLNLMGTPVMVNKTGKVIMGAMPSSEIEKFIR